MAHQSPKKESTLAQRIHQQLIVHSAEEKHGLTHDFILCYIMLFLRLYYINEKNVNVDYVWFQVKCYIYIVYFVFVVLCAITAMFILYEYATNS